MSTGGKCPLFFSEICIFFNFHTELNKCNTLSKKQLLVFNILDIWAVPVERQNIENTVLRMKSIICIEMVDYMFSKNISFQQYLKPSFK